jgi:hypothetical protein
MFLHLVVSLIIARKNTLFDYKKRNGPPLIVGKPYTIDIEIPSLTK